MGGQILQSSLDQLSFQVTFNSLKDKVDDTVKSLFIFSKRLLSHRTDCVNKGGRLFLLLLAVTVSSITQMSYAHPQRVED